MTGDKAGTHATEPYQRVPLVLDVGDATDRPHEYAPGHRLGDAYEISEVIGSGGMGVVYRAIELRSGKTIALKQLPARAPRVWRKRLHEEAKLLARASHPNIAQARDVFVASDGTPHLVMEHVDGETLSACLDRGSLPMNEAMRICRAIADAVLAAHEEGVLHLDLKPGNVMITKRGEVKVIDFGLAIEWRRPGDPAASRHGGGTPGYISPEQRCGGPRSERTDIYALGCVLHDCLVGHADKPPSVRDVGALPPNTPSSVRRLVACCLRADPMERPAGMRTVCRTLGAVILRTGRSETPPRSAGSPTGDQIEPLLGRDRDLVVLSRRVRSERAVTFVGSAGIGKTRLALAVLEETRFDFRDGSFFVPLAGIRSADRVAETVLQTIEPGRGAPDGDVVGALERHIGRRHLLLVLDDPARVIEACSRLIRRLQESCPDLHVLATCREPLGIPQEHTAPIAPLETPASGVADAAAMRDAPAVRLFLARAGWGREDPNADDATLIAVSAICRRLAGNPFSIQLAAAQARSEGPDAVLARLRREGSPRAAFDLAIEALPAEAVELLGLLSVFEAGFACEQAVQLADTRYSADDVAGILETLVSRQLLVRRTSVSSSRYELPELLRELILARGGSAIEGETARDRHHEIFRAFMERARAGLYEDQRGWLERIEQEHENVLAALRWSESAARRDDPTRATLIVGALRMASALGLFWDMRGLTATGRAVLERALSMPGSAEFPSDRALALNAAGNMAQRTGDAAAARRSFLEALMIHRAAGDVVGVSRVLNGLGILAFDEGELGEARSRLQESVEIKASMGLDDRLAIPLNNLGRVELLLGDAAAARTTLQRAARTCAEGDRHTRASALNNLGIAEFRLGDPAAARRAIEESLTIRLEIGDCVAISFSVDAAAELALPTGEPSRAAEWRGAAERLRSEFHSELSQGDRAFLANLDRRLRDRLGDERWAEHDRVGRGRVWETVVDEVRELLRQEG